MITIKLPKKKKNSFLKWHVAQTKKGMVSLKVNIILWSQSILCEQKIS